MSINIKQMYVDEARVIIPPVSDGSCMSLDSSIFNGAVMAGIQEGDRMYCFGNVKPNTTFVGEMDYGDLRNKDHDGKRIMGSLLAKLMDVDISKRGYTVVRKYDGVFYQSSIGEDEEVMRDLKAERERLNEDVSKSVLKFLGDMNNAPKTAEAGTNVQCLIQRGNAWGSCDGAAGALRYRGDDLMMIVDLVDQAYDEFNERYIQWQSLYEAVSRIYSIDVAKFQRVMLSNPYYRTHVINGHLCAYKYCLRFDTVSIKHFESTVPPYVLDFKTYQLDRIPYMRNNGRLTSLCLHDVMYYGDPLVRMFPDPEAEDYLDLFFKKHSAKIGMTGSSKKDVMWFMERHYAKVSDEQANGIKRAALRYPAIIVAPAVSCVNTWNEMVVMTNGPFSIADIGYTERLGLEIDVAYSTDKIYYRPRSNDPLSGKGMIRFVIATDFGPVQRYYATNLTTLGVPPIGVSPVVSNRLSIPIDYKCNGIAINTIEVDDSAVYHGYASYPLGKFSRDRLCRSDPVTKKRRRSVRALNPCKTPRLAMTKKEPKISGSIWEGYMKNARQCETFSAWRSDAAMRSCGVVFFVLGDRAPKDFTCVDDGLSVYMSLVYNNFEIDILSSGRVTVDEVDQHYVYATLGKEFTDHIERLFRAPDKDVFRVAFLMDGDHVTTTNVVFDAFAVSAAGAIEGGYVGQEYLG